MGKVVGTLRWCQYEGTTLFAEYPLGREKKPAAARVGLDCNHGKLASREAHEYKAVLRDAIHENAIPLGRVRLADYPCIAEHRAACVTLSYSSSHPSAKAPRGGTSTGPTKR